MPDELHAAKAAGSERLDHFEIIEAATFELLRNAAALDSNKKCIQNAEEFAGRARRQQTGGGGGGGVCTVERRSQEAIHAGSI